MQGYHAIHGKRKKIGAHAPKHDSAQHASHGHHNQKYGLPKDVFAHDGQPYGPGANTSASPEVEGAPMGGGFNGGFGTPAGMDDNQCDSD